MIRLSIVFIFLVAVFSCDTTSNIKPPDKSYFVKYFGGEGNQKAVGLIVNSDGTFFILGNSRSATGVNQQVYLAKADAEGNRVWETTYGSTEMVAKGFLVANGTLVVAADKLSLRGDWDVQLIRFALTGDTLQSAILQIEPQLTSTPKDERANSITLLNDGGFLIPGYTNYVTQSNHQIDALHFRTDINFKQIVTSAGWRETSGSGVNNYAAKGFQTPADTCYIFGSSDGPTPPHYDLDFWVFGLDSKGAPTGQSDDNLEFVSTTLDDNVTDVQKASLGGYLISGIATDKSSQNLGLKIIKIRFDDLKFSTGSSNIQFSYPGRSLGKGSNGFATGCNSSTGYYVLANSYGSTSTSDMMLIKLDITLQEVWNKPVTMGGDGDDTAAAVAELPDGRIMVLGTMNLGNPAEQFKIALMKLNSAGKLGD
jgi:hypothetical protein